MAWCQVALPQRYDEKVYRLSENWGNCASREMIPLAGLEYQRRATVRGISVNFLSCQLLPILNE